MPPRPRRAKDREEIDTRDTIAQAVARDLVRLFDEESLDRWLSSGTKLEVAFKALLEAGYRGESNREPGAADFERGPDILHSLAVSTQERIAALEQEVAELKSLLQEPAILVDEGVVRLNENRMVPYQVYEVDTPQGPMQFVKEGDGAIRVYEVYESQDDQVAKGPQ